MKLRLHVRTVWSEWHGHYHVFYCLAGIDPKRPTLRTTWDTDIRRSYRTAKKVARGEYVTHSDGLYRLVGDVTYDPPH